MIREFAFLALLISFAALFFTSEEKGSARQRGLGLAFIVLTIISRHLSVFRGYTSSLEIVLLLVVDLQLVALVIPMGGVKQRLAQIHDLGMKWGAAALLLGYLVWLRGSDRLSLYLSWPKTTGYLLGTLVLLSCLSVIIMYVWFSHMGRRPLYDYRFGFSRISARFVLSALGFALLNSLSEELLFRSALFSEFRGELSFYVANTSQAVVFGFVHFKGGFPSGWLGVLMTSVFGFILGMIVEHTGSIVPGAGVHFCVNLSMFFMVEHRR